MRSTIVQLGTNLVDVLVLDPPENRVVDFAFDSEAITREGLIQFDHDHCFVITDETLNGRVDRLTFGLGFR